MHSTLGGATIWLYFLVKRYPKLSSVMNSELLRLQVQMNSERVNRFNQSEGWDWVNFWIY